MVGFERYLSSGVLQAIQEMNYHNSFQTTTSTAGTNVQVTSNVQSQNEPSVAIDPSHPRRLVVGANDMSLGFAWLGCYTSPDGGLTWTSGTIPHANLASFSYASDPSVVFDKKGALYYGGVAFNALSGQPVDGSIFVSRSLDGGASYNRTVIVAQGFLTNKNNIFNDKPYITVDMSNGADEGRVYVSWTRFTSTRLTSIADIMVAYSANGGASFSTPTKISSSPENQGSIPIVGPSGELYVVWEDNSTSTIEEVKSTNGGLSFSTPPITVSNYVNLPSRLPNSSFRTNSFPTTSVDDTIGNVYVAWADYRNGHADILFSRSTDGGTTWNASTKVNDDNTGNDHFLPWMSVSSGHLTIVFYDRRLYLANHLVDVFQATSANGGTSFSPNVRVTDTSSDPGSLPFIGDYIAVASNATTSHPVWTDLRSVSANTPQDENIYTDNVVVDHPPIIDPISSQTVDEGKQLSFVARATDPDKAEVLTLKAQPLPSGSSFPSGSSTNGTVTANFAWTPIEGQGSANYTIKIIASDGFFIRNENVTIHVNHVNIAPMISVSSGVSINETFRVTFKVTATDSDMPPETVTLSCDKCSAIGASFDSTSGNFTWIPAEGRFGDYYVTFTATDNGNPPQSSSKSVLIHVLDLNFPPSLTPVPDQKVEDETLLTFNVLASDPDIPAEPLTFSLAAGVPFGASISPSGVFSWIPNENQGSNVYKLTIIVSDGSLTTSEIVSITVTETITAPVLSVPGPQTVEAGSLLIFTVNFTYPDPYDMLQSVGLVTISAAGLPPGSNFDNDTGTLDWTPSDSEAPGVYRVIFTATGPGGLSDSKSVTINVISTAQPTAPLSGKLGTLVPWAVALAALLFLIYGTLLRAMKRKKGSP
jgi:hypothetical protein